MGEFPQSMKRPANRISPFHQHTPGIEGFVFEGADGGQMAFWTCSEDATTAEHAHPFDEYFVVVEGVYWLNLDGNEVRVGAGEEGFIPAGTLISGRAEAGTRTIHHFAGRRIGLRRYHHIGIPTDMPRAGETYLERYGVHCTDHESNPFGIQWMRFDRDCPLPDLVKSVAHIAFEVDDLAAELVDREVLIEPNSPSEGVLVAFIVEDGAPVELMQFGDAAGRHHGSH